MSNHFEAHYYHGRLPQIWIEHDCYHVKSHDFEYFIACENPFFDKYKRKKMDPIYKLFRLSRGMSPAQIEATYCY